MKFEKNDFKNNYKKMEILRNEFLGLLEKNWNPNINSQELEIQLYIESVEILIKKYDLRLFFDYDSDFLIFNNYEFIVEIKIHQ